MVSVGSWAWNTHERFHFFLGLLPDLAFNSAFAAASAISRSLARIIFFCVLSLGFWSLSLLAEEVSSFRQQKSVLYWCIGFNTLHTTYPTNLVLRKLMKAIRNRNPYKCSIFFSCSGGVIPGTVFLYICVISADSLLWVSSVFSDWLLWESHWIVIESEDDT